MKSVKLTLSFLIFTLIVHTEGVSQVGVSKPKIAAKSVATSAKKITPVRAAKIKFDNMTLNLGTIKEDAVIEKTFEFTNIGEKDLVIINAKGSCGCTVPTPPVAPIVPGGKGKISVKYTAKNKVGPQKPTITVTTNGVPSVVKLNMEAWVEQIPGGVN
ncbi:MAG: DUF1573 domain-containing protein [Saprospiraceae bacterium]|nr:DUF1573 domain-containing protein [Saprospiraceae bacterium]